MPALFPSLNVPLEIHLSHSSRSIGRGRRGSAAKEHDVHNGPGILSRSRARAHVAHGDNIYDPSSLSLNHYIGPPFGYASCTHNPTPFTTADLKAPCRPPPNSPSSTFSTLKTARNPPVCHPVSHFLFPFFVFPPHPLSTRIRVPWAR